jgi:hypothetical protein
MKLKSILAILALTTLTVAQSCGSNPAEPENPVAPGADISGTIQPAGGQLTGTVKGGAQVTLDFPAGAVRQSTDITIRSLDPEPGNWMKIALEPAGMVFFESLTMTVVAPAGPVLTDVQMVFGHVTDSLPIPTTLDIPSRTLTSPIRFFGLNEDGSRVLPGLAASQASNHNNNVQPVQLPCVQLVNIAEQRFDGFLAIGDFNRAVESALASAAALQNQTCPEAQAWLNSASAAACDALGAAISDAANANTSNYGEFRAQAEKIIFWAGGAQALNPSCSHLSDFLTAIDNEISDFLIFYQTRLGNLTANDMPTFSALKDEAQTLLQLMADGYTLSLANASDRIENQALIPTLNQMRTVAYRMGADHHWHYPLSRLTSMGFYAARDIIGQTPPRPGPIWPPPAQITSAFTNEDIYEDLQFCATNVNMEALVVSGGSLASRQAGGGVSPGQKTDQIALDTPTRGKLKLDGDLFGFDCFEDLEADKELVFELNGTEVLTVRRPVGGDNYFATDPAELDIMAAAQAAGITPSEGNSHDLVVKRIRSDCQEEMWGPAEYTVLKTELRWQNPQLDVKFNFPDLVQPGSQTQAEIRVEVEDQHGNNAYFDDIQINLNVTGGTAAQTSGTTDANGYFRTTITANQSAFSGQAAAELGQLQIVATASAPEGVSDQDTETASVQSYLLAWTFHDGLQGWTLHKSSIDWSKAEWEGWGGGGMIELDAVGNNDPGPNAWAEHTFTMPAEARTLTYDRSAHNRNNGTTFNRVRLKDGSGTIHILQDWEQMSTGAEGLDWVSATRNIANYAGQQVTLYLEIEDQDGGGNNQTYWDNILITR